MEKPKATLKQVAQFFGTERLVTNSELMKFHKEDPEGLVRLREELVEYLAREK